MPRWSRFVSLSPKPLTRSLPLLTLALLLAAPQPSAAQTTGTVTGTVTSSSTGLPLANTNVGIFAVNGASAGSATTNAAGAYTISNIQPGAVYFVVAFGDSSFNSVAEAYPDSKCTGSCTTGIFTDATPIAVAGGATVANINFALDPAARISGTVTNAGAPVLGVTVFAVTRIGTSTLFAASSTTNAAGAYSIGGMPAGTYFLLTTNTTGLRNEIYDNIPCIGGCSSTTAVNEGTAIVLATGAAATGRDFGLETGGRITGTVTDATTGAPVAGAFVQALIRVGTTSSSGGSATTNAAGEYTISGLASGSYGVAVSLPANLNYTQEIYSDILCPLGCSTNAVIDSGTLVPVALGGTTPGINFALSPGASISGTATNEVTGLPIQSLSVTAVVMVGSTAFTRNVQTNASGAYTITGLPAGSYALYTSGNTYHNEIYNNLACPNNTCANATAFNTGSRIAVTAGGTAGGNDFALQPRPTGGITGVVTDVASGLPIGGAGVEVWASGGGTLSLIGTTTTNLSGVYTRLDLAPGPTYYAATTSSTGAHRFRNELFDNIPCLGTSCPTSLISSGTAISVTAGVQSPANFALSRADGISGTVTNAATGQPLAGVTVNIMTTTGTPAGSAASSATGTFAVHGLPNGTYVAFTINSLGFHNEIYNNVRCTATCPLASGTPITVTGAAAFVEGAELVTGINFALDVRDQAPAAPSNLRIVTASGTSVFTWTAPSLSAAGAPTSYLLEAGFGPGATFITLPIPGTATTFTVPGVPPGTYYVRVRAVNGFGTGPASNEVLLVVGAGGTGLPDAPTNLLAFVSNGLLTMTWSPAFGGGPPADYIVEAGSASGAANIASISVGRALFTYAPVPPGFYFLRVRARNAAGIGAASTEVLVVVGGVPSPPNAPNFSSHSVSGSTVTLNWQAPLGTPATSYIIEAGSAPGLSNLAVATVGNVLTQSFSGVPPGTYYVRLRAVNAQGASVVSNERTIIVS